MARYKIDALAELHTVEGRLASARKSLNNTGNRTTAHIELAKIPGLERKAAELRVEITTLPERPALTFAYGTGDNDWKKPSTVSHDDPILQTLEIPDFLKRTLAKT